MATFIAFGSDAPRIQLPIAVVASVQRLVACNDDEYPPPDLSLMRTGSPVRLAGP